LKRPVVDVRAPLRTIPPDSSVVVVVGVVVVGVLVVGEETVPVAAIRQGTATRGHDGEVTEFCRMARRVLVLE
jgi:hypothetical protein